jgi:hypothetical protein
VTACKQRSLLRAQQDPSYTRAALHTAQEWAGACLCKTSSSCDARGWIEFCVLTRTNDTKGSQNAGTLQQQCHSEKPAKVWRQGMRQEYVRKCTSEPKPHTTPTAPCGAAAHLCKSCCGDESCLLSCDRPCVFVAGQELRMLVANMTPTSAPPPWYTQQSADLC